MCIWVSVLRIYHIADLCSSRENLTKPLKSYLTKAWVTGDRVVASTMLVLTLLSHQRYSLSKWYKCLVVWQCNMAARGQLIWSSITPSFKPSMNNQSGIFRSDWWLWRLGDEGVRDVNFCTGCTSSSNLHVSESCSKALQNSVKHQAVLA